MDQEKQKVDLFRDFPQKKFHFFAKMVKSQFLNSKAFSAYLVVALVELSRLFFSADKFKAVFLSLRKLDSFVGVC